MVRKWLQRRRLRRAIADHKAIELLAQHGHLAEQVAWERMRSSDVPAEERALYRFVFRAIEAEQRGQSA